MVFEKFNRLLNDLKLHDKYYKTEEINMKFLVTLSNHLEHRISSIREGKIMYEIYLESLYNILKTYEIELQQKRAIQAGQRGKMENVKCL